MCGRALIYVMFSLQIIVPKKRAAILIDRLMVALKKAIEEEAEAGQGVSDGSAKTTYTLRPEDAVRTVHIFSFFYSWLFHKIITSLSIFYPLIWLLSGGGRGMPDSECPSGS